MRSRGPVVSLVLLLQLCWPVAAWADLRFAQPAVDLGRVRIGVPLTHRFAFVAAAAGGLTIKDVKTTCGCAVPALTQQQYRDGESGMVEVTFHTLSQPPGPQLWSVRIHYLEGDALKETTLQLRADLVREVLVEPAAVSVTTDQPLQREIVVKDLRLRPFTITSVQSSSPQITVQLDKPTRDGEGRWMCRVALTVRPAAAAERHEGVVVLHTDDPDYREVRVPVTIQTRRAQAVVVSPAEVTLTAPVGEPVASQRVLLRHREGLPLVIEKVETGTPALQATWAPGEQRFGTVRVALDRTQHRGGELRAVLQVYVSGPIREVVPVPVTVRVP